MANTTERIRLLTRLPWHAVWLCLYVLRVPLGMAILTGARALQPLVKLKIGRLVYGRVGHLAANTELFLRRQARCRSTHKEWYIFAAGKPANQQLMRMIKRRIYVIESGLVLPIFEEFGRLSEGFDLWEGLPFQTNEYDEFNNVPPQLWFTQQEKVHGREILASMGIEPGQPFVCFHARDKAYLDTVQNCRTRDEWSYHDFRDGDIMNCLPAVKHLASQGIYALRMGSVVEQEISVIHPHIVDYASHFRSDFADVFLSANCKFFLGDTAGIRFLSQIFNVPIAMANSVPLCDISLGKFDVFIPKKYWSVEQKRFLTFREIIAMGADYWDRSELYARAGIEVIKNSAEEILALACELNARLDGTWNCMEEDEELQRRFRALFQPGHRSYGFLSCIGAEFLRQNRELLD